MAVAAPGPRAPEANAPEVVPGGVAGPLGFAVQSPPAVRVITVVAERTAAVAAPPLPAPSELQR